MNRGTEFSRLFWTVKPSHGGSVTTEAAEASRPASTLRDGSIRAYAVACHVDAAIVARLAHRGGRAGAGPGSFADVRHFYSTIQAAVDGLGVAMGPTALIADDLAAGRLVTPFPKISLPARSSFAYFPEARRNDPHGAVFRDGLEQQGRQTG